MTGLTETRRVLVVDDESSIRDVLSMALEDEGYDVRTAPNGREALSMLDAWLPHVIVLDLMMPVMDGWTFRSEQRTRGSSYQVPVIVLSAARDVHTHAEALHASEVVPKPFDLEHLLGVVDRLSDGTSGTFARR